MCAAPNVYDEMPYPSWSFPQTTPNRIGAVARLFGVPAALPAKARVLELGCANGTNLLPLAEMFPEARFLGLDNSEVQVTAGRRAIEELGFRNVELRHQDVLDFGGEEGEFDYIVAHGFYSWVPPAVREKVLALAGGKLAAAGVSFISFNALPGANTRDSLRALLRALTAETADAVTRTRQARSIFAHLESAIAGSPQPHGDLLRAELASAKDKPDAYFRHEYLTDSTSFYVHDFLRDAARHGLQYLGENNLVTMLLGNYAEPARQVLMKLPAPAPQELFMDFLQHRAFRQTLLCRAGTKIRRQLSTEQMRDFAFQATFENSPTEIYLAPDVPVTFTAKGGHRVPLSAAATKAALHHLAGHPARAIAFAELARVAEGVSPGAPVGLAADLMTLYTRGLVELSLTPIDGSSTPPARPFASPLARYQARTLGNITSRLHRSTAADHLARAIVAECDGRRTRDELLEILVKQVAVGRIKATARGPGQATEAVVRSSLAAGLDHVLREMAWHGVFT